jgi:hypothetical protein
MVNNSIVKVVSVERINGSKRRVTKNTVINLGTKVNVCSEIEVAAWKIDIESPTINDASSSGPTTSITV